MAFLNEIDQTPRFDLTSLECKDGCHAFWYRHDHATRSLDTPKKTAPFGSNPTREDNLLLGRQDGVRRARFFDGIIKLIGQLGTTREPALIFHNFEEADPGTLELLDDMIRTSERWPGHLQGKPAGFVLITIADRDLLPEHIASRLVDYASHIVRVPDFDRAAFQTYLSDSDVCNAIYQKTGGSPEALERLLAASPLTPEQYVTQVFSKLEEQTALAIRVLSIFDRGITTQTLSSFAPEISSHGREQARACSLIEAATDAGETLLRFKRPEYKDAVYETLTRDARRNFHKRAAKFLVSTRQAQRAQDAELVGEVLLAESNLLAQGHCHDQAVALLKNFRGEVPDSYHGSVDAQLCEFLRILGRYHEASDVCKRLLDADPNNLEHHVAFGQLLLLSGRLDEAQETTRKRGRYFGRRRYQTHRSHRAFGGVSISKAQLRRRKEAGRKKRVRNQHVSNHRSNFIFSTHSVK